MVRVIVLAVERETRVRNSPGDGHKRVCPTVDIEFGDQTPASWLVRLNCVFWPLLTAGAVGVRPDTAGTHGV